MPFYIRKSFSLGKFLRINLSKSGLGYSFGVTGADGGLEFIRLQSLLEEMEKRANAGDDAADKVLGAVYQMARLIHVANKT